MIDKCVCCGYEEEVNEDGFCTICETSIENFGDWTDDIDYEYGEFDDGRY